ncbi:MAG: hypothetical protein ABI759_10810 [Candidatus Solibacter sp.]
MRYAVFLATVAAAFAQVNSKVTSGDPVITVGTQTKPSVAEYPTQTKSGPVDLGADYMVHSFGAGEQMYLAENFLVVEVALFPPKGETVQVESGQFALRINGKKQMFMPITPAMAAANLNRRSESRGPMAGINLGGIGIGTGSQQGPNGRYPQDPNGQGGQYPQDPNGQGGPQQRRMPTPPRAPDGDYPDSARKPVERAEDILIRTALPNGSFKGPVSGFLYFPYTGKASSVKTAELLYQDAVLKLK